MTIKQSECGKHGCNLIVQLLSHPNIVPHSQQRPIQLVPGAVASGDVSTRICKSGRVEWGWHRDAGRLLEFWVLCGAQEYDKI